MFQHRMNGSQNFYLNWDEYENGFGDLNGEFWLGLCKIHRLTATTSHTNMLRVDLGDFDANTAYAKYSTFMVGDSVSNYTLTVSGYTGTARDSLAVHNGRQFSTADRDNDNLEDANCAQYTVEAGGITAVTTQTWMAATTTQGLNPILMGYPGITGSVLINTPFILHEGHWDEAAPRVIILWQMWHYIPDLICTCSWCTHQCSCVVIVEHSIASGRGF